MIETYDMTCFECGDDRESTTFYMYYEIGREHEPGYSGNEDVSLATLKDTDDLDINSICEDCKDDYMEILNG
jgi:hypothetical protein